MDHTDPTKDLIVIDEHSRVSRWLPAAVVFAVVSGFVALAWYAYHAGMQSLKNDDLLVVEPDKTPVKEKPASPGGMEFPDQDKTIFDTFNGAPPPAKVERVLPSPEQPAAPPEQADNTTTDIIPNHQTGGSEQIIAPIGTDKKEAPAAAPASPGSPQTQAAVTVPPPAAAPATQTSPEKPAPTIKSAELPAPATPKTHAAAAKKVAPVEAFPAKSISIAGPQVQLGAYHSEQEASDAWKAMQKKHKSLAGKQPVILKADLGARGIYYRLRLGGFASAADAKTFCKALTAAHQACILPVH